MSLLAVLFAVALRLAPCHNRLCGNMSPLTASVNESSVGVLVALDALVVTVEVLVVAVLREPVEPVAHAVSATTKAQNLISLRKCIRNKFEKSF